MAKMAVLPSSGAWKTASDLAGWQDPKFVPIPIPGLGSLLSSGLERGTIAEITGRRSSGRTAACLHVLAQATSRGEVCAVVDLYDSFHPASAAAAGVALDRVVWVRCRGQAEHAMRAADLLLHAGGFGLVLLDLCDASPRMLNRIPMSYWYRFRGAIQDTTTILLICAEVAQAKACSASIEIRPRRLQWVGHLPLRVLQGIEGTAVLKNTVATPQPLVIRSAA